MSHRSLSRSLALSAAVWPLLALACQSGRAPAQDAHPSDEVNRLLRQGEYEEAVRITEAAAAAAPGDELAAERHRMASVAWILERVRRLSFAGEREAALSELGPALELAPDAPQVRAWERHLRAQLARSKVEVALDLYARDDLNGAVKEYELALAYTPEDEHIEAALGAVLLQQGLRQGLGEQYYQSGLAALNDYYLEQARHDFASTIKFDPTQEQAQRRGAEAKRLLANQRALIAAELEAEQRWSAARNEYRLALLLDPESEQAAQGMLRTTIEEEATELVRNAERELKKGRFDQAQELARRAVERSELQKPSFEGFVESIAEARLGDWYDRALTLEKAQQYPEALGLYARILEQAPFFKDTIARQETLNSYVTEATELYDRALASQDEQEQLALLRRVAVLWEGFKDVRQRLSLLESRLEPAANGGSPQDG